MNKKLEIKVIDQIKKVSFEFLNKEVDPVFIGKGSKTHVYKIDDQWVIKLNSQSDKYLHTEKDLIDFCIRNGIKGAEIRDIGSFEINKDNDKGETEVVNINYAFQQLIVGKELTDNEVNAEIFIALGRDLKKLHNIALEKFGRLDLSSIGNFESWNEYLKTHVVEEYSQLVIGDFPKDIACSLEFITKVKLPKARFCYGDLKFEHIFIENGKFLQLVDFDYCLAGDPMYDFAVYDYYCDFYNKDPRTKEWIRYRGVDESLISEYKRLIAIKKLGVYTLTESDQPEKAIKAKEILIDYFNHK